jgi:hypothetical protein
MFPPPINPALRNGAGFGSVFTISPDKIVQTGESGWRASGFEGRGRAEL